MDGKVSRKANRLKNKFVAIFPIPERLKSEIKSKPFEVLFDDMGKVFSEAKEELKSIPSWLNHLRLVNNEQSQNYQSEDSISKEDLENTLLLIENLAKLYS